MKNTTLLLQQLKSGTYNELLKEIYVDTNKLAYVKQRYTNAIEMFERIFGAGEVCVFSAPGRSEIGGNHTDHQHGEVLAASINKDGIAVVRATDDGMVSVKSEGYDVLTFSVEDIERKDSEKETTISLLKGVLAGFRDRGYRVGGFQAYITSDVLIGAGLSSSAAFETLVGTILNGLYNDMSVSPIDIAIIGQFAENVYFGKPSGLMDQMASSVGSLVHIDFADPKAPIVEKVEFDFDDKGYSLCITDTKGSHADLTYEYAAVPKEMKAVAALFGKEVLRDVSLQEVLANAGTIRVELGDRAFLRALHFTQENIRVQKQVAALQENDIAEFLKQIKASGDSSYKYLQNVYTNQDVAHQNVSVALAVSEILLGKEGANRVHGGGFAGTIQAFVPNAMVAAYKAGMEQVFGEGSCEVLKVRKYGGMRVL